MILKMSQSTISQHLRKLSDIELVKEERKGQSVFFSIIENYQYI
ncbi:ArsR family transcriptional regulator [Sporosarcina sp. P17b]